MQCLYRIHTENLMGTTEIVAKHFDGFTMIQDTGYWRGESERSAVYEIYGDKNLATEFKVMACAEEIRRENKQEAVLVTMLPLMGSRMVGKE